MFDSPSGEGAMIEKYPGGLSPMKPRTKLERLKDMKKGLEIKLEEVNLAIILLEANPQLVEIINALERTGV